MKCRNKIRHTGTVLEGVHYVHYKVELHLFGLQSRWPDLCLLSSSTIADSISSCDKKRVKKPWDIDRVFSN